MNSFFHGSRFYALAATGVLLLLATLSLMVWMQMVAPYQRQSEILEYLTTLDIIAVTVNYEDEPYPSWIPSMIAERLPARKRLISCLLACSVRGEFVRLTEADLRQLSRLPFVRAISFRNVLLPSSGINACLPKRPLTELGLTNTDIDDSMVEKLPMFPEMKGLSVQHFESGLPLTDHGLAALVERCPGLENLWFFGAGTPLGPETIKTIGEKRELKGLVLNGIAGLADADFEQWKNLDKLERLDLFQSKQLTGKGLSFFSHLHSMKYLSLWSSGVTDEGLECLKKTTSLTALVLTNTAITDEGLSRMKDLHELSFLSLDYTKITDAGLEHLKELKSLETLYLNDTNITDAGLDALDSFPSLKDVRHSGTKTTKKWTKKP